MKRLKRFLESSIFDEEIQELQDVCGWLSDVVDELSISPNGEVNGERRYNIVIRVEYDDTAIGDIVNNTKKLNEIVKEYAELLERLQSMGYQVSYHLLETTMHLKFTTMRGQIQLAKR